MKLSTGEVARLIDLSAVRANTDEDEVQALVETARAYGCAMVYTLPCYVPMVRDLLRHRPEIGIGGVVGFPSGGDLTAIKVAQTMANLELGCTELDMVMNVGWLRSGRDDEVEEDVRGVVRATRGRTLKVILEVAYLTDDEIRRACELCIRAGADFVKTGTGWAGQPTTAEHIRLIKAAVNERIKIKASGGLRTIAAVTEMYRLGATRFGMGAAHARRLLAEWEQQPGGVVEA